MLRFVVRRRRRRLIVVLALGTASLAVFWRDCPCTTRLQNAMTSSKVRTSAEGESSRLPRRAVTATDGLLRPPLLRGAKHSISVLEQILGWKGVV